jgi:hypothetical protein
MGCDGHDWVLVDYKMEFVNFVINLKLFNKSQIFVENSVSWQLVSWLVDNTLVRNMMSYLFVTRHQHFGATFCLCVQGRRFGPTKKIVLRLF